MLIVCFCACLIELQPRELLDWTGPGPTSVPAAVYKWSCPDWLLQAANYLDIEPLLMLAVNAVADKVGGEAPFLPVHVRRCTHPCVTSTARAPALLLFLQRMWQLVGNMHGRVWCCKHTS